MNEFLGLRLAMELANDVVAFDRHIVRLAEDRKLGLPDMLWHYDGGPMYSGREYARATRRVNVLIELANEEKLAASSGIVWRNCRRLIATLKYKRLPMGHIIIGRDDVDSHYSRPDVELLHAALNLGIAAMHDAEVLELLQRLHLHFLDRRTAIYQARDSRFVLARYLEKAECVLHPESESQTSTYSSDCVRLAAILCNVPRTALYTVAHLPNNVTDWPATKLATRFDMGGKWNVRGRVFSSKRPVLKGHCRRAKKPGLAAFSNTESMMCAPVAAGDEDCWGVLTIENARKNAYNKHHLCAFTLLAGDAARPVGRAIDQELARGRLEDLATVKDTLSTLQTCTDWSEIHGVLCKGLPGLKYHRGLICEVLHEEKRVKGRISWAGNVSDRDMMAELCRKTDRHFLRNKVDCQIRAVLTKQPQVIRNPNDDKAAHREALRIARLGPFVIIPMLNNRGEVKWTLHVEREDVAPIGDLEVASLLEICRAAMVVGEHLEKADADRKAADISMLWAEKLQRRFVRQDEILDELVEFAAQRVCTRCRVYRVDGEEQMGVCYSGPRLRQIEDFSRFKLRPGSKRLLKILREESKPLVCAASRRVGGPYRGEFRVEYVWPVPQCKKLDKAGLAEWVEVPMVVEGDVVAKAVFDKKRKGSGPREQMFTVAELRVLAAMGKLTALSLERTRLELALLHHAAIGACTLVHKHEMSNDILRLEGEALLGALRGPHPPSVGAVSGLVDGIYRATQRAKKLKAFFDNAFKEGTRVKPYTVTVSSEIHLVLDHLPLPESVLTLPPKRIGVKVPGNKHPLYLILLQLLQNAYRAVRKSGHITLKFEKGGGGCPHVIDVIDTGVGISKSLADEIRGHWKNKGRSLHGMGLECARLVAAGEGWHFKLKRRARPTWFQILLPTAK